LSTMVRNSLVDKDFERGLVSGTVKEWLMLMIIAITATNEGLSREEIGRHLWAHLMPMEETCLYLSLISIRVKQ